MLKKKIHDIIFYADTKEGKGFDVVLLILILLSVSLVMLESVESFKIRFGNYFELLEWTFSILFTIEYLVRIAVSPKPIKYIFSFFGVIDLISILPKFLSLFFVGSNVLTTIRAFRLLRVFRILKLAKYTGESNKLIRALIASRIKISVFIIAVLIWCVILGAIMYLVEGEGSAFTSIPKSIYWCIVTLTTVGFGDITPETPLGQFIASLVMIIGYGVIAVPTGIISAEYTNELSTNINKKAKLIKRKSCPHCGAERPRGLKANYCHQCGKPLHNHHE